jgi:hypothetical protein
MKVNLTEKEALFLYHAAWLSEGFLDFENNTELQFEARYGFTKEDADKMEASLRIKLKPKDPNRVQITGKKVWS